MKALRLLKKDIDYNKMSKKLYKEYKVKGPYDIKLTKSLCYETLKEDFKVGMNEQELYEESSLSMNLILNGY